MLCEHFAVGGDRDGVQAVDEDDHGGAGTPSSVAEVHHAVAESQGDFPVRVDGVVADPPDVWVIGLRRCCFRDQRVGEGGRASVQCPVGTVLVVVLEKLIELALQFLERVGGAHREALLQRLPEPFDLALRGRLVRFAVLLRDAVQGQQCLERVAGGASLQAAGETGGEDVAVVGQRCRGEPVHGGRLLEGVGDGAARDAQVARQMRDETGVVIDPANDLDLASVGEAPVGGVATSR